MAHSFPSQKGSVLILFAVSLTVIMLGLALCVDIGWILVARGQLQSAADASALASAKELVDEDILTGAPDQTDDIQSARDVAQVYAALNQAANRSLLVDRNDANDPSGDVVVGQIDNPTLWSSPFAAGNSECNSVLVRTQLSNRVNGPLGLFLGMVTGKQAVEVGAESVASVDDRVIGFDLKPDEMFDLFPFTVFVDAWDEAFDGGAHRADNSCPHTPDTDDYFYSKDSGMVTGGGDGVAEIKMYPYKDGICKSPGAPGNFGTIDIGPADNSTSDISSQIRYGVTTNDLLAIGGLYMTDEDGDGIFSKWLNGDTGVSSAIKDDLESIKGKPRLLPLYRTMYGTGNNAMYEIVRFVPIRIVHVKMTGSLDHRYIAVQPCQLTMANAMIHPDAPHVGYINAVSLTR